MYFTNTPELRKFEREMKQNPTLTGAVMIMMKSRMQMFLTTKNSKQTKQT